MRSATGHDDLRRDARPILTHTLQHPLPHLRPRGAILLRRIPQHDQRVEVRSARIGKWEGAVEEEDNTDVNRAAHKRKNEQPTKPDQAEVPSVNDVLQVLVAVDRIELSTYGL